jgi:hypothetical protein
MAILKKEVSSAPPAPTSAPLPPRIENYTGGGPGRELSIIRQAACHDVFQGGWFKDYSQTVSVDEAIKKGLEVAAQIEAWVTR